MQDFLQVFQGCGIGKMEDNLTSADPPSYTANGSRIDQGARSERLFLNSNIGCGFHKQFCQFNTEIKARWRDVNDR